MKNPTIWSRLLTICLALMTAASMAAQNMPPASPPDDDLTGDIEMPSLAELDESDLFRSWQDRFQIRLPNFPQEATIVDSKKENKPTMGQEYLWNLVEAQFIVRSSTLMDGSLSSLSAAEIKDRLDQACLSGMTAAKGTLISTESIRQGSIPGQSAKFHLPSGGVGYVTIFIEGDDIFLMAAIANPGDSESEKLVEKTIASFRILSPAEIEADGKRAIKESMPKPLPQTPVAAKPRSDAFDEDLKGRVKRVIEDERVVLGEWRSPHRIRTSESDFNARGNFVQQIFYSSGYPFNINVYGYLSGARVSRNETIDGALIMSIFSVGEPDTRTRDKRYDYKYSYKYKAGRLAEMRYLDNAGDVWLRYVYEYAGGTKTETVYDSDDELNQRYTYNLDSKGLVVESTSDNTMDEEVPTTDTTRYQYDTFDRVGNWTQRTALTQVRSGDTSKWTPTLIEYRTITYYP